MTQWIFRSKNCSCLTASDSDTKLYDAVLPQDEMIEGLPYHFTGVAGRGGIGTVYKAISNKLGRPVAVKILQAQDDDPRASQVFMREAKAASKVQHPNILTILDFGEMKDGSLYMVAEWLDGITLAQYLTRHGRVPVETAVEIACQILDGLSHAHKNNVVHRDIKPSNIMLERTISGGWTVKIIDFGTAKEIGQEGALTRAENIACSPYYMSPEQATGLLIEQTSDLYSLGCSLFEAMTGRPPFIGPAMNVVMRHQTEPAPTLSSAAGGAEFPVYLEQIVAKLLEKSPTDRFQTAAEVKDALLQRMEVADHESAKSQPLRVKPAVLIGVVGAIAVIGVTFPILFTQSQSNAPSKVSIGPKREISSIMPQLEELEPGDGTAKYFEHGDTRKLGHLKFSQFAKFDGKKFHSLDFRYSGLTDKTLYLIDNATELEHLDLTETEVTDEGLKKLPSIKSLAQIRLKATSVTDEGLKNVLPKYPSLVSIDVCDTAISDAGVEAIAKVPTVRNVNLALTKVTDKGIITLVQSVPLISNLNLSGVPITDKSLDVIAANMKDLGYLLIANTAVTDAGIAKLKNLSQLRRVFLSDNGHITQASIDDLHRSLPRCSIIVSGMGKNRIVSRVNRDDFKDDGTAVLVNLETNRTQNKDEEANFSQDSTGNR